MGTRQLLLTIYLSVVRCKRNCSFVSNSIVKDFSSLFLLGTAMNEILVAMHFVPPVALHATSVGTFFF